MRKYSKIIAPLLALMLAFALVGCGEDAPATSGFGEKVLWTQNVLLVDNTTNSWAGLDIKGAGLVAGDTIEVKGVAVTGGVQILLNLNHNGWDPLQNWNPSIKADEEFEKKFTLEAADITKIGTASPTNIRIRLNAVGKFVITDLLVKSGTTTVVDLATDLQDLPKGKLTTADLAAGIQGTQAAGSDAQVSFTVLGP